MFLLFPISFWIGFALGTAYGRWQAERARRMGRRGARPMRLVTLDYTPPVIPAHSSQTLSQWDLYVISFCFHGNLSGFSYRRMRDVCRRRAWETYTSLLADAGVIRVEARSETDWAGGWGYPALRVAVKNGRLSLPYPTGNPPALASAHMTAQMAQRSTGGADGARQ